MSPVAAIVYRETKIRITNVTFLFWDMIYPLAYLLVFGVGLNAALGSPIPQAGVSYDSFFLAGVLGMASFGIASNSSWSFFMDRDNGIFYEMLTYPMSRAEYLLGKTLFNTCIALIQAAITILLGGWLLGIRVRADLLSLLVLGIFVGTSAWFFFYSIFALRIRRNDVFNSLTSVFYFVFLFASSIFYPLEPLPGWFRKAALLNPITWQVDLLRYASLGIGDTKKLPWEIAAFVIFTLAAFAGAVRSLQRRN